MMPKFDPVLEEKTYSVKAKNAPPTQVHPIVLTIIFFVMLGITLFFNGA